MTVWIQATDNIKVAYQISLKVAVSEKEVLQSATYLSINNLETSLLERLFQRA